MVRKFISKNMHVVRQLQAAYVYYLIWGSFAALLAAAIFSMWSEFTILILHVLAWTFVLSDKGEGLQGE